MFINRAMHSVLQNIMNKRATQSDKTNRLHQLLELGIPENGVSTCF